MRFLVLFNSRLQMIDARETGGRILGRSSLPLSRSINLHHFHRLCPNSNLLFLRLSICH